MARRSIGIILLLVGLPCLLPLTAQAARVDAPAARGIASAFLERIHATSVEPAREIEVQAERETLAYIVTLDPAGYIVVSADDALPPVIAYSLESQYPDGDGAGDPLSTLVAADLQSRMAALPQLDAGVAQARAQAWSDLAAGASRRDDRFEQWPPEGSTPTGGWILTNWTQSAPYNALCPLDLAHGGGRSQAGCPAVAMAMILNYHATIQETVFGTGDRYWHNYSGNAYWIPDASAQYGFPNFATLNGYLQTLTQHWDTGTPLTNTDKAALVFGCGVAARQVYSAAGSGTFGVNQAFTAYQRFAFADCRLALDSDPNLYPDLAVQMQSALPAHLAVVDPGWTMGHNLVIDGYNTDDYFHLNFGWGGSYNGWYLLPEEIPYGLTVIEGVVLDIVPAASSLDGEPASIAACGLTGWPNPFDARVALSYTVPSAGRARLDVVDAQGRLQARLLDRAVAPGVRSLDWSADRLPAGAYWVRLQLGGRVVETRRLVRVR